MGSKALDRLSSRFVMTASTVAATVGVAVLIGWSLNLPGLGLIPSFLSMKANTAVCLVLLGVALWLFRDDAERPLRTWPYVLAVGCTVCAVSVGAVTLVEYAGGWDLGVDQLVFHEPPGAGNPWPGRMSPLTASALVLLGAALTLLHAGPGSSRLPWLRFRHQTWVGQMLAAGAIVIGLLGSLAHLFGATAIFQVQNTTQFAVHTSLTFIVLGAGVLCLRPGEAAMGILTSPHAGGVMARRLLPAAIAIPALLGSLLLAGERAQWFDSGTGEAVVALLTMITLMAIIWWAAIPLNRTGHALEERTGELARSNTDLEHFAYLASHDLQEPLRMVSGYTQLLAKRYKGKLDSDADEFIAFAVDGANRMRALIDDLLSYSRVGSRGKDLRPVAARDAADNALRNLQSQVERSGARIVIDELPTISADQVQLELLFQNLMGNAMKFHGAEPPRVHLTAGLVGDAWTFTVRDNGIGIDPAHNEKLFKMFQRLHSREEYPGTGMGLAICRRIVERHGGRIWVESAPGKGSAFKFTVPATPEQVRERTTAEARHTMEQMMQSRARELV